MKTDLVFAKCFLRREASRLWRDDGGSIWVTVALCMFALLGAGAIAVDFSHMFQKRANLQAAADAAALAGVVELPDTERAKEIAVIYAQANMAPSQHGQVLVEVDVLTGNWDATARVFTPDGEPLNAVQTTTRRAASNNNALPLSLAQVFGLTSMDVNTEAAQGVSETGFCVLATDPVKQGAIQVNGSATITFECGIAAFSTHPTNAMETWGEVQVIAESICVAGGTSSAGASSIYPVPVPGCTPPTDPLSGLQPPSYSGCDYTGYFYSSQANVTLSPGVYCGGINIEGATSVITFEPGIYILDGGGMRVAGQHDTLNGTGVMFYNTSSTGSDFGKIVITAANTINVSAPTSGTYEGILFFQDPSPESANANVKFDVTGAAETNFDGAIYFPDHPILQSGGSSQLNTCTKIIGRTITFSGNSESQIYSTASCASGAVYIGPKLRLVN